ncbi:NAD(P)H-binding protein [Streptomyces venezuelae]|uniref:NAD(P)-binding domain-containing protein n=1 Tax=Streptomyces venezuelae TaxID=54571 RepID=A0A5P2BC60_STRVZ|nr:NAD(P)H-binding protein [Streptomyces venezuelae]QES27530.1 hypothetical protein DEJ47_14665 [Streptomyces venezuelae]
MLRIAVFGAAGNAKSRVVTEALARGHEVTAVVRAPSRCPDLNPDAIHRTGDAQNPDHVAALPTGQHVIVAATRPAQVARPNARRSPDHSCPASPAPPTP